MVEKAKMTVLVDRLEIVGHGLRECPRVGEVGIFARREIGAQRLVKPVAAGFGPALGLRVVTLPIGHGQDYTGRTGGEMPGQACMGFAAMAGSARHLEATGPASGRLSSGSLAAVAQW